MLKRYRLLFIALGGIAFIAAILAAGLYFQPKYLGEAEAPSAKSQPEAANQGATGDRRVTCYQDCQVHFGARQSSETGEGQNEAGEAQAKGNSPDHTREGLDLLAQQRMAYWAIWLAGFTFIGLIALFWTLYETRRVTIETSRVGQAQTRAYISARESAFSFKNGSQLIKFSLELYNFGSSPAKEVRVQNVRIGFGPRSVQKPHFMRFEDLIFYEIPAKSEGIKEGRIEFDNTAKYGSALCRGDIYLFITGTVSFIDVFNKENTTEIAVSGMTDKRADQEFVFHGKLTRTNPDVWRNI